MNIENIKKALHEILVLVKAIIAKESILMIVIKGLPALTIKFKLLGAEIRDLDEAEISELIDIITSYGFSIEKSGEFIKHLTEKNRVTLRSIFKLMR